MSTTCKVLIEAAYERSVANDADKLGSDPELVGVIWRRLYQIYSIAARVNPAYFGKISSAALPSSNVWARPSDAELVFKVLAGTAGSTGVLTSGTEVNIVPVDDTLCEMAPRIYEMGRSYYSVDATGDPDNVDTTGDKLSFYYSKRHPALDTTLATDHATNTLESDWPEQFNDLLVLHLSKYLSVKDGMRDSAEWQALNAEEEALMVLFHSHLQHENYGMRARYGQSQVQVTPTVKGAEVR